MIVKDLLGSAVALSEDKKQITEEWRDVKGYEGLYMVSNLGRVKRLNTVGKCKSRWGGVRKISFKEKILAPAICNSGYEVVHPCKNGKHKNVMIHRMVAISFIPNPENKTQENHINGIKTDNRAKNLEWCTQTENLIHSYYPLGNTNKGQKLVINKDTGIIYESIGEAANSHGMKYSTLWAQISGRNPKKYNLELC